MSKVTVNPFDTDLKLTQFKDSPPPLSHPSVVLSKIIVLQIKLHLCTEEHRFKSHLTNAPYNFPISQKLNIAGIQTFKITDSSHQDKCYKNSRNRD